MSTLTLARPRTAFVEAERLSGQTESGIFVLDHHEAHDMSGSPISLLWRVLDCADDCRHVQAGRVYAAANPYAFSVVEKDGERYAVMHEDNLIAEIEGYDEQTVLNEQTIVDAPETYPVCGK